MKTPHGADGARKPLGIPQDGLKLFDAFGADNREWECDHAAVVIGNWSIYVVLSPSIRACEHEVPQPLDQHGEEPVRDRTAMASQLTCCWL